MFCDWKWCRFFTLEQKAADNITGSENEYLQEQLIILRGFFAFFIQTKMEDFCSYMYTTCFR